MNLPTLPTTLLFLEVAALIISAIAFLMGVFLILSAKRFIPHKKTRPAFPYLYDRTAAITPKSKDQSRETTLV
jgi:hypothetical protein